MITFWDFFWSVIALVLVIEGFLPALCPECWRKLVRTLSDYNDVALRRMGLTMMIAGALVLVIVHHIV